MTQIRFICNTEYNNNSNKVSTENTFDILSQYVIAKDAETEIEFAIMELWNY